ncbi:hypothetical protein TNCV_1614401 [Trichonephila clavipes]|uniref:Uncharacterized protein n=1 Tax=Trichonephila clavipes TaxID=2585209 RepID=A0A8X6VAS7_TRICX|nr:hypothetical protein TNCV_1614401 [Trichonephila clavipes]
MRESIMYVNDKESIGAEKGIQMHTRAAIRLAKASHTCSMGFKSGAYAGQSIRVISSLSCSKSPMWPCIVIHKNEVWANGTSEQTLMGKKYLLTIAIPLLQTLFRKCGAQFARLA